MHHPNNTIGLMMGESRTETKAIQLFNVGNDQLDPRSGELDLHINVN